MILILKVIILELCCRVHLNSEYDIDIPEDMRNTDQYCATLAHKSNHSFTPNCRWSRIDHPRFGLICSLTANTVIMEGEEITVNYRLPLHLAPQWYLECHEQHLARKRRVSTHVDNTIENIFDETACTIKEKEDLVNTIEKILDKPVYIIREEDDVENAIENILDDIIAYIINEEMVEKNTEKHDNINYNNEESVEDRRQFQEQRMI